MSATTSQPIAGQHKSAAPFGAVAVLAAVVAFGAIGIAVSQNVRTAAPAGPDIAAARDYPDQIAARIGTASTVTDYTDQIAARLGQSPSLSMIMTESLLADRYGDAGALFAARYNSNTSVAGPSLAETEALFSARYNSNTSVAGPSLAETEALFASRYNSNPSYAATQPLSVIETEGLLANRYGTVSNLNPGEIVLRNLGQDGGLTGLSAGPQTGHQKGLDAPKVGHAGPAKHPVAN